MVQLGLELEYHKPYLITKSECKEVEKLNE